MWHQGVRTRRTRRTIAVNEKGHRTYITKITHSIVKCYEIQSIDKGIKLIKTKNVNTFSIIKHFIYIIPYYCVLAVK